MPEEIESVRGPSLAERVLGGWRVVASAWLMAIVIVVLFAGVQALASRHSPSPRQENLAGAVIPRHDPGCDNAAATQACAPTLEDFERAESQAYYGW